MTPAAYRAKQFARALGVSERKVWRMLSEGQISSRKVGGCRLIPASELDRLLGVSTTATDRPAIPVSREALKFLRGML